VWIRTVGEDPHWITEGGFWTGNLDANAITSIPKPTVLAWTEDRRSERWFRTEAMTLVGAPLASSEPAPTKAPDIDGGWLTQLRKALATLATTPPSRIAHTQDAVARRLHEHFGDQVDATVERWVTAHNDLHWANLTAPALTILDWEGWGIAPAGYDAATLYCHSLLVPETARQVHEQFAHVLDTPDGKRSQLFASARILDRARRGDYRDLAGPVRNYSRGLF
jgi:thiamine kinase-like enzyme